MTINKGSVPFYRKGHVWQGRFFSAALDEAYLWAAVRYVERNPVRARMVRKAENYRWSSASAHCQLRQDDVLTKKAAWQKQFESIGDWSAWLAEGTSRSSWKYCGVTRKRLTLRFGEIHSEAGEADGAGVTVPAAWTPAEA